VVSSVCGLLSVAVVRINHGVWRVSGLNNLVEGICPFISLAAAALAASLKSRKKSFGVN